jgi:hypothetical protein
MVIPTSCRQITALCVTNVLQYVSVLALSFEDVLCVAPGGLLVSGHWIATFAFVMFVIIPTIPCGALENIQCSKGMILIG